MNEHPVVLTINCGSSSVKFSVLDAETCDVLLSGICEGINTSCAFITVNDGEPVKLAHQTYEDALPQYLRNLKKEI